MTVTKGPKQEEVSFSQMVLHPEIGQLVSFPRSLTQEVPGDGGEDIVRQSVSDQATSAQTTEITGLKGSWQAVKEVGIYIPGSPGDASYFDVHRTDKTLGPGNRLGGMYYGVSNLIIFDRVTWSRKALKLSIDHNMGGSNTSNIYIIVRYYYR